MNGAELAKPLHLQRLEHALCLDYFLDYVENVAKQPISDDETASESEAEGGFSLKNGLHRTREEREVDRSYLYNFSGVRRKRQWLKEVLLSSSSEEDNEDEEGGSDTSEELTHEELENMLKEHRIRKYHQSHFYQNEENRGYLYYGAGLLSRVDKYPEHQRFMAGSRRKKNKEKKEKERLKKIKKEEEEEEIEPVSPLMGMDDSLHSFPDDGSDDALPTPSKGKVKVNKKEKKPKKLDAQALAVRRHKLWVLMAKKEVGRCQKSKASYRKEVIQNCKRVATACMRLCRQKAVQSQKAVKDKAWMLKRLTRTMQGEWKKFDRIIREQNRRAEREAEEQRKMDKEIMEVKRQQRKLNFLITLPELYAHFMKNKLGAAGLENDEDTSSILKQLEEDGSSFPMSTSDEYDSEALKAQALKTAQEAYSNQQTRLSMFRSTGEGDMGEGGGGGGMLAPKSGIIPGKDQKDHAQPSIFKGKLKSYQLKGMNWLANLYYFGINGILADEMGLGKTVQSIAFLGHICEEYDSWGPFLIVTPASTLHNWTGEIARFVPTFEVVPYWGNPEERKNLRKFFDTKNLGTRDASFHVVITSYQIVIQDFKFLNRLKWNYMVLDEAQAIKSINSQRWKLLLGFSCRNRLLLSGTPIQNSMAELWALLHFIMPSLFDSHQWFNEWFSKDIEGHVENKTAVDETHLNRLHMILKPFMLRRVKTEVENELSDKIEIMMYCPLTLRQKYLYNGLKNKISIEELLRTSMGSSSSSSNSSVTSSLMNLVMQFRKVCNHPELLERREVRSPFTLHPEPYQIPKLVFREALLHRAFPSKDHILYNKLSIFNTQYIHNSLKEEKSPKCFSFLRFIDSSPQKLMMSVHGGLLGRWLLVFDSMKHDHLRYHRYQWQRDHLSNPSKACQVSFLLSNESPTCPLAIAQSCVLTDLVFTSHSSCVYTFQDHIIHSMPETLQHRILRSQKASKPLIEVIEDVKVEPENGVKEEPLDGDCDVDGEQTAPTKNSRTPVKKPPASPEEEDSFQMNVKFSPIQKSPETPTKSPKKKSGVRGGPRKGGAGSRKDPSKDGREDGTLTILPEFVHVERKPLILSCQPTTLPTFLMDTCGKAHSTVHDLYAYDRGAAWWRLQHELCYSSLGLSCVLYGSPELEEEWQTRNNLFTGVRLGGIQAIHPRRGWNHIVIPDKHTLIMDAGKLYVLDTLLSRLKAGGHRVLIYSQMTKMIDVLEEYMWHRKHKYMRLDGSSKISDRRDMVADFQTRTDIFVFLLSTRAGGLGINLTAADTVIFYDSDWNPTVDQQAMDRAHRLGQTKQVTVYRLICKSTIEERILQRAREKSEIQRMVISGGNFKPDTLKPKEVVSLLLDDDIEKQYRAKQAERRAVEEQKLEVNREKMRERQRKRYAEKKLERELEDKRRRLEEGQDPSGSMPASPSHSELSMSMSGVHDDTSNDGSLVVDVDSPSTPSTPSSTSLTSLLNAPAPSVPSLVTASSTPPIRGQRKRGRPKGSTLRGRLSRSVEASLAASSSVNASTSSSTLTFSNAIGTTGMSSSAGTASPSGAPTVTLPIKRGRGRPRLLPVGPGHQGTRAPPTLPLALGTALNTSKNNQEDPTSKPFGYYT
ncbi:chromatin-remodeling ATPase INO80 [Oratosquilla oratoria]|uniref:chromatin-remodeling ATPase INO80 n=1 Tax=Oratosquilla oratoria TaxID=337810 RepID=UPI003F77067B